MRVKNTLNLRFLLTASWGANQNEDITVVFTVDIENTVWKESVAYYPLLDELYNSLEETPIPSSMKVPSFPLELLDNYQKLVQLLSMDSRKPHQEEMLTAIALKIEEFVGGLLSNLGDLPAEVKGICKQMFFRSLNKIQVFECILCKAWVNNSNNSTKTRRGQADSRELAALKQVLTTKTQADLLKDALEGVRAELSMQLIARSAPETVLSVSSPPKDENVDIKVENLGSDFQDVRVSVMSSQSPLLAQLKPAPLATGLSDSVGENPNLRREKVDLTQLGLTELDVAATIHELQHGVSCQFLLPDKSFHGRLCLATIKLPEDMNLVDVALVIQSGKKVQNTRLVYDIKVDIGKAHEGKGPTLVSVPEGIHPSWMFHLLLHNRPELNFVAKDEHHRNKLMVALNQATAGSRSSPREATRQSLTATSFITRQSSCATPTSAGGSTGGGFFDGSKSLTSTDSVTSPRSQTFTRPPLAPASSTTSVVSIESPTSRGSTVQPWGVGQPPSRSNSSTVNASIAMDSSAPGDARLSDASNADELELSEFPFSMPLKMMTFCWANISSKVLQTDITSAALPHISARGRLPASSLLEEPLKLVIASTLNELVVFSLPADWTSVAHKKVRELDGVLRNLIGVPVPVNMLSKKKVVCETVIFTPSVAFVDEKHDVMLLAREDGLVMNIYVENPEDRVGILSALLYCRKSTMATQRSLAGPLSISTNGSNDSGSRGTNGSTPASPLPVLRSGGSTPTVFRSSVSTPRGQNMASPRAVMALND